MTLAVSIHNCWAKCGLTVGPSEEEAEAAEDTPMRKEWLVIDAHLPVCRSNSDEEIIAEVKEEMSINPKGPKEDSDEDGDEEEEVATVKMLKNAIDVLHKGLPHHGYNNFMLLDKFESSVHSVLRLSLSQSKIDKFFTKMNYNV